MNVKVKEVSVYPDGRLNTENAANYIGLSLKTLAMMRCKGDGPRFVRRGRIFYYQKDIDAWLQAGEGTSTAQVRHKRQRALEGLSSDPKGGGDGNLAQ